MRRMIVYSVFSVCFFSCNTSDDKTVVNNSGENIAIVDKYRNAVEKKDIQTMDSLLADNYIGYGPSVNDSINKEQALDKWKDESNQLYDSVQYTLSQDIGVNIPGTGITAGDWVSNWAYLTLKYKDGRGPVHLWVNVCYKIENKKIARSRTFYNEADVLRQLGYTFVQPQ